MTKMNVLKLSDTLFIETTLFMCIKLSDGDLIVELLLANISDDSLLPCWNDFENIEWNF